MKAHVLTTLALLAAPAFAAVAAPHNVLVSRDEPGTDTSPAQLQALVLLLDAVHDVPDSVLDAGQESADRWFATEAFPAAGGTVAARSAPVSSDVALHSRRDSGSVISVQAETQGLLSCLASIAWFLAENRIPIAKLRRAKKIIDDLGGVRKAAQKLLKGKKNKKKLIAEGGQILWELFEIFSGAGDVIDNCSS